MSVIGSTMCSDRVARPTGGFLLACRVRAASISSVMAITALLTVKKAEGDSFTVEMADELGSITVQVSVPRGRGGRIYSEAERERIARLNAQELALAFAEHLLDDREIH